MSETATDIKPMMACGHRANAHGSKVVDGVRVEFPHACVICDCFTIADSPPDLTGRKARCSYCKKERDSTDKWLAFFGHRPNELYDEYYCGCRGWD